MTNDDGLPRKDDTGNDPTDDLDIELFPPEAPEFEDGSLPPVADRVPDPATDPDMLVIDAEDLLDVDDTLPSPGMTGEALPPVDGAFDGGFHGDAKAKGGLFAAGMMGSLLLQMALAGALGGMVAWAVIEPYIGPREGRLDAPPETAVVLLEALFLGLAIGAPIGMALGAVEGVVVGAWTRALTGGLLCLMIGGAGSMLGSVGASLMYNLLGGGSVSTHILQQVAARALGWAILGACVGLGPGVVMKAPRKVLNGLLGGLAGGFIGGLLFDPIGAVLQGVTGAGTGLVSRLVGFTVLGSCAGFGVGLVEEIRKQAWVQIVSGPLTGKQFILYKPVTWIGSAPGMDIPLVKDQAIAPKHCTLEEAPGGHAVRCTGAAQTLVNGRPVQTQRLADGDVLQIGHTGMQYRTRPMPAIPPMYG